MPTIGDTAHGTGEAAKGTAGEDGYKHAEGKTPNPSTDDYGQGGGGRGPQIVTEGDSSRTTPLKGSK